MPKRDRATSGTPAPEESPKSLIFNASSPENRHPGADWSIEERREQAVRASGEAAAFRFSAASSQLFELLSIKQTKESEAYVALGVTWDEYCPRYLGRSRRTVDEDLQNLEAFGERFLDMAGGLSIGRRALRELRRLPADTRPRVLESGIVEIDGERFSLDQKDQVAEAIDTLIAKQNELANKVEQGAEQHSELKSKVADLTRENARMKSSGLTPLPEGITQVDRLLINAQIALAEAAKVIEDDDSVDPARVKKHLPKIDDQMQRLRKLTGIYVADPDAPRPDGWTPEVEAEIDAIFADE